MSRRFIASLTLKEPSKIAADDIFVLLLFLFYFYLRHDVSCESPARQRIHVKYQV